MPLDLFPFPSYIPDMENFILNSPIIAGALRAIFKDNPAAAKEEIRIFLVNNIPEDTPPPYDFLIRIGIDALDYTRLIDLIQKRIQNN